MLHEVVLADLTLVVERDQNPSQNSKEGWRKLVYTTIVLSTLSMVLAALFKGYIGYDNDEYCMFDSVPFY